MNFTNSARAGSIVLVPVNSGFAKSSNFSFGAFLRAASSDSQLSPSGCCVRRADAVVFFTMDLRGEFRFVFQRLTIRLLATGTARLASRTWTTEAD